MKRLMMLVAIFAVAMMVQPGLAEAQRRGGEVAVALYANANSIDPNFTASHISRSMLLGVYETLVAVDEDTNVVPMLASGWEISPGGLVYTFRLREGVRFHNGKIMTSADVKASLERFARVSPDRITMAPVAAIETPSPSVVVIRLREPSPSFLDRLASPASPASIIPSEDGDKELNRTSNIGTGPFQFVEWVPDSHITLRRFDGYVPNEASAGPTGFGGRKTVWLDRVIFRIMPEAAARVAGLETGQVQLAQDIPVPAAQRLRGDARFAIHELTTFNMPVLFVNHAIAPTNNLRVRQAIQAALDLDEAMAGGTDGLYSLDHSWVWPGNPFYSDAGRALYNINNQARARQLLQEAGYRNEPIVFNISNISFHSRIGTVVVEQLRAAGINVQANRLEWPTLVAAAQTDTGWNLATAGFSSQPFLGAYAYQPLFVGPTNWSRIRSNPAMEAAWARFNTSMDPLVRRAAWAEVQRISYEDVQIIKLGNQRFLIAASTRLRGYRPYIGGERLWDVWLD